MQQVAICGIYFILNLLFLTRYPFVHSDEAWLALLTRDMLDGGTFAMTERCFDLLPRYPHAIKLIFHALQMPFILAFGFEISAVRLLSLIAGTVCLPFIYSFVRKDNSHFRALMAMGIVGFAPSFIVAAHVARAEILLVLFAIILLNLIRRGLYIQAGAVTGLAIGLHPNSFVLFIGCISAMIAFRAKKHDWLIYIGLVCAFAAVFITISFIMDSQFPIHYLEYGDREFDIAQPISGKLGELGYYFQKLWFRVSATYYLPELRPLLILMPIILFLAFASNRRSLSAWFAVGALVGTALIGRYNQMSAVIYIVPCLLAALEIKLLPRAMPAALCSLMLVSGIADVALNSKSDYGLFESNVRVCAPASEPTLGNLSMGFCFDSGMMYDVRNLAYLKDSGISIAEYIESRGIKTIVWYDEYDTIYELRPTWNILYGNPRWVPELKEFIAKSCTPIASFEDEYYVGRIVSGMGSAHSITVYRLVD